jgi:hypothetical protein
MAMGSTANNNNALFWAVDAGSPTTLMTLNTSGNLGLGVTPSAWRSGERAIDIAGGAAITGVANEARIYANAFVDSAPAFKYKATAAASFYSLSSGGHFWYTAASGTAGNTITFTQSMTLDAGGNLGIGTSSPDTRLHVDGATNTTIRVTSTTNADFRGFGIGASEADPAEYASFKLNANTGELRTYVGPNTYGGFQTFYTNGSERARITSGGDLLVGTTDATFTSGVGAKIKAGTLGLVKSESTNSTSSYHAYSTGAGAYRFYVGDGGTVFATNTTISAISDQRLKENVQDLDAGLDKIMALKPRKFDWKAGKGKDIKGDRGWIAQEFEQVFPDMIDTWKDESPEGEEPYKSVRADLIPVLVKAIQEQQAIIEQLKADVAALKGA